MTYAKELLRDLTKQIGQVYDQDEAQSIAFLLIEHFLHLNKTDMLANKAIPSDQLVDWSAIVNRLRQHEPVQYIIGKTEFFGLEFIVNPSVLIPRPETEELVDWIIKEYQVANGILSMLDIGTGSGCIAISLSKNIRQASVEAWDISERALAVAEQNATMNKATIAFKKVTILDPATAPDFTPKLYDCIVSNPPYIKKSEAEQMRANVLSYEPHLALFVEDAAPLLFYEKIAQFCQHSLKPSGFCYLEVNEQYADEVKQLFLDNGFDHSLVRNDLFGKPRFVKAGRHLAEV